MPDSGPYPATASARDRFVVGRRGPRPDHDPWRYQNLLVEDEPTRDGPVARVATVFLTGRECPWRCAMCDLWRHTIVGDTPRGAILVQLAAARRALDRESVPVTGIKLYNASNFFDPRAVPDADYDEAARELAGFSRVVVESHPALIGERVDRLLDALGRHAAAPPSLEVAMGLETVHPAALEQLNKRISIDGFRQATHALLDRGVDVRVFLLIAPPFVAAHEQEEWLQRSVEVAFSCGASIVSLIPTRAGNGALDELAAAGLFREPTLDDVERGAELALAHARNRGLSFVDVWDLERFSTCAHCFQARRDRLGSMNLVQRVLPRLACSSHDPVAQWS